jgi:hypothetical protein
LQLKLLVFQRRNEGFDGGEALFCLLGIADEKFVVAMSLEFRRLVSEGSADTVTESQFRAISCSIAVGKAFPSKIFYLREELLELLDCASDLFYCNGLRPRPFG